MVLWGRGLSILRFIRVERIDSFRVLKGRFRFYGERGVTGRSVYDWWVRVFFGYSWVNVG